MNRKKLLAMILTIYALLLSAYVSASTAKPFFQHIVFFGDSLSDNGNLYRHTDGIIPKSPPYYRGRFSNGYTWAELLSFNLYKKYQVDSENYAVGGATAYFHNPFGGFLPISISMEYDKYALDHLLKDKSNTLYCILIGANDYLPGVKDVDTATTNVVNAIASLANRLASINNASLLIVGLPDLAYAPAAKQRGLTANYQALVTEHNQKLHEAILNLRNKYPNVKIMEFNFIKDPVIRNMVTSKIYRDNLNKKYHLNINDVIDTCWTGGLTQQKEASIAHHISIHSPQKNDFLLNGQSSSPISRQSLANAIAHSPSLSEAYSVGESSNSTGTVCEHPDEYIFWDHVHPTEAAHTVLADMIFELIENNIN